MKQNKNSEQHITYLILAHKIPSQVAVLVKALNNKNTAFVIHIDLSIPCDGFVDYFEGQENVSILTERVLSGWGTFGMVEACLAGMKFIIRNLSTGRVVLLSGQDYPIKPEKYISAYFQNNADSIFIDYLKLPSPKRFGGSLARFPDTIRPVSAKTLYSGSQWWSFPMKIVRFILQYLVDNPEFVSYFRKVYVPDESFFQTLLLNCNDKTITKHIVNDSLKLIKWDPPYMHPRVLTVTDQNTVLKSKSLYARKFDIIESKQLLTFINRVILGQPETLFKTTNDEKQIVLMLTNRGNEMLEMQYNQLYDEVKAYGQVQLLHHHTVKDSICWNKLRNEPFAFTNSILGDMGYVPIAKTLVPGSNHFPLLKFYLENPDFDYYWLIEDDVIFPKGWRYFFEFLENETFDFLSSHLKNYDDDPKWYWWESITYKNRSISEDKKMKSFNPIYRISNSAMEFLHHCLSNGWTGHHEVLIPTLLKLGGFSMANLGGSGLYTPERLREKFYKDPTDEENHSVSLSSMRFRPQINQNEINEPYLYHPVKL